MKQKKEIFLVPYSHLDTQWRWEYPTTIKKYIKKTLEESISLFEKYPEHQFNFTGALRYAMMKDYYPEHFEKVKKYIIEGRWHLAGTCLDETDALVPSVESMVRNILYGDRWVEKEFGKSSRDYMIPDCFGFPANMPSIMAHCGIEGFSSNKLTWGSAVGIPFEIGVWKGPDGSEIVSALNPCRYDSHMEFPVHWNPGRLKRLNKLGKKNDIWKSFQYYGVGDVGGAPKEGSVKRALGTIKHYAGKAKGIIVRQGSADQFFKNISDDEKSRMDRYEGDFLLTNHSAGTITSAAIMKRWNRKNEQLAYAAETAAVTALWAAGAPYPSEKIESAWQRVIGSQMHDILPGTSTPTAYEYSHNDEVIALNTWSSILEDSAKAIAPHINGNGDILLFNPYSESRKDPVHIELPPGDDYSGKTVVLKNAEGESFPGQINKTDSGKSVVTFLPQLAPLSWSRFSILQAEASVKTSVWITTEANHYILENALYSVMISINGEIQSIYHKVMERELLKNPLAYEFQKERPLKFPAWNMDWRDRKKNPFSRIENGGSVSIIEEGPLKCTIQIITDYKSSRLTKEISLSADSEIVDFTERINWRETGCSLKLALTTNMSNPELTCNWETSRIKRPVNHKKVFEMPSRLWADMSDDKWGISIIEDSKYGYDHPYDDTLRMTLLYTPALRYYNGFWDQKTHDWGEHTIRYAIYGHEGDWKGTDNLAKRFNQPVRSFSLPENEPSGSLKNLSLFELSSENIGVLAVKKAEDHEGIVIRLYERHGENNSAVLTFASDIVEVHEINGLEEIQGKVSVDGRKFTANLEANGIGSYLVTLSSRKVENIFRQKQLELPCNKKIIGFNREKGETLFPAEQTPEIIRSGSVTYKIARDAEQDSLSCEGQEIVIPEGFDTLSLLTGSEKECTVPFTWIDSEGNIVKEENIHISSMTGFIGQWDKRKWKREPKHYKKLRADYAWLNKCTGVSPGYINRDRLEWYSTHTHKDGVDQAYQYGYLFTVKLDIPESAAAIRLPVENAAKILAMTVSEQKNGVKRINYLKDKFDF